MVLALATTSLVLGAVTGPKRPTRKGKKTMPKKSLFRDKSHSGTKRFPRGRLVLDRNPSSLAAKMTVVVGSAVDPQTNRKVILINHGRKGQSQAAKPSELSVITIRRSVLGLKGKGTVKPRVQGKITTKKIRDLKTTTQRQLDRAGG